MATPQMLLAQFAVRPQIARRRCEALVVTGPLQKVDNRAVVLLFYRPCMGESLFESERWMFKTCHCLVDDLDFLGGKV